MESFSAGFFTLNNCLPSSMQSQSSCFANGCPFASTTVLPSEGQSYKRLQTTSLLPLPFMFQVLHISPWSQHIREHDYASCWRIPWPVAWWLVGVHDAGTWCQRCRPWMAMNGRGQNQMRRLNEKDWTSSSEAIYIHIYIYLFIIHYTLHSYCFFFSGLLHLIVESSKIPLRVQASGHGA